MNDLTTGELVDLREEAAPPAPAMADETVSTPPNPTSEELLTDEEIAVEPDISEPTLGAPTLAAALEALLLITDEPMTSISLAEITATPEAEIVVQLTELALGYRAQGRGFELRQVSAGWRFYTAIECRDLVTRYVTDGRQSKLSQAALETLAIVAYRQPVTRNQVGAVRGVNADGVLKTLQSRGLINQDVEDADGAAAHFVTTDYFLDRMGLASLDELPPIADHLPDFGALDEFLD